MAHGAPVLLLVLLVGASSTTVVMRPSSAAVLLVAAFVPSGATRPLARGRGCRTCIISANTTSASVSRLRMTQVNADVLHPGGNAIKRGRRVGLLAATTASGGRGGGGARRRRLWKWTGALRSGCGGTWCLRLLIDICGRRPVLLVHRSWCLGAPAIEQINSEAAMMPQFRKGTYLAWNTGVIASSASLAVTVSSTVVARESCREKGGIEVVSAITCVDILLIAKWQNT